MTAEDIKQEIGVELGLPFNGGDITVRRAKVAYRNRYHWIIQSKKVNLWDIQEQMRKIYPGYTASSCVYATIPFGQ